MLKWAREPIEFYGIVVDQHGAPVEGATVTVGLDNVPYPKQPRDVIYTSDNQGKFAVTGHRGASIWVDVAKEGYLQVIDEGRGRPPDCPLSYGQFEFGSAVDKGARYKNPAKPTALGLFKLGPLEPLKWVVKKLREVTPDGVPIQFEVERPGVRAPHQIAFRLNSDRVPLTDENHDETWNQRYDWRFEMSIPGGGFVKSTGPYEFTAPETGYQERVVAECAADAPEGEWKEFHRAYYFVKFADGTFGRYEIDLDADGGSVSVFGCMNPKVGSRNLAAAGPPSPWD